MRIDWNRLNDFFGRFGMLGSLGIIGIWGIGMFGIEIWGMFCILGIFGNLWMLGILGNELGVKFFLWIDGWFWECDEV